MGSTPQAITPRLTLRWSGRLLFSAGVAVFSLLGLHLVREELDQQAVMASPYLSAAQTPLFNLPAATPFPSATPTPLPSATLPPTATATSTPLPTPTPLPFPAIRISIAAIHLNTSITEIAPTREIVSGREENIWEVPAFAAGHFDSSGRPGEGTNIVLIGHNNTLGEVFRSLDKLNPGDEIVLFTEISEYRYQVQKKFYVPYRGVEADGDAALKAYSAPTGSETLTLISCWPYATNANRIVIQAISAVGEGFNGQ